MVRSMIAFREISSLYLRCPHPRLAYSLRHISISRTTLQNHYDVLGISKNSSRDIIKEAYFKKSKLLHPDAKPSDPSQHQKFIELTNAYSVLSKPLSRRDYDLELQGVRVSPYRVHVHRTSTSHPFGSTGEYASHDYYGFSNDPNVGVHYYGIKGIRKVSNMTIMIGCVILLVVSALGHFILLHYGAQFTARQLDERDRKISKIYSEVKRRARENGPKKQMELLRQNYEEFHRKKNKKIQEGSSDP
ncbi:dnaJ homolog subfamily C member 4-like [Saccoglossus kowalevskii]|uniref:DnaJ homolog subfamily C member 4-like n=1 Tax=Saccoglossus kowalevskii TaxID=10224 RepID=A0ABM0GMS7_SACKO|nr:PREDICTED: dnaJ homolog subfamily C member 4-like [Saccoglossus kowalevskii]